MNKLIKTLLNIATAIVTGSLAKYAIRMINVVTDTVTRKIASILEDLNRPDLAKSVRHFGRGVIKLGKALVTACDIYGTYQTIMDVKQYFDDVSIANQRMTLLGPAYISEEAN